MERTELARRIRDHSQAAAAKVKLEGRDNDLIERLRADAAFDGVDLKRVTDPRLYVGRAPQQVDEFIKEYVTPIRRRYRRVLARKSVLSV